MLVADQNKYMKTLTPPITRYRLPFLAVCMAGAVILGTCGCKSSQQEVSFKSGNMTQTFAEGASSVPKDFPLPVYPGATATGSVSGEGQDAEQSRFLMLSSSDSVETVSSYYQNQLKKLGWSVDNVQPAAEKLVSITAHQNDMEANVMLNDDDGKTVISLSVGKSSDTSKDDAESGSDNYSPNKVTPATD